MTGTWHGGKGSTARPKAVSDAEFSSAWDRAFGSNAAATECPPIGKPVHTHQDITEQEIVMIDGTGFAMGRTGEWHVYTVPPGHEGEYIPTFYELGEVVEEGSYDDDQGEGDESN